MQTWRYVRYRRALAWLHRKDTRKQRPRFYRVMLHNDNYNRREYVVQVLLKVIPGMTVDDAVNVMQARCAPLRVS